MIIAEKMKGKFRVEWYTLKTKYFIFTNDDKISKQSKGSAIKLTGRIIAFNNNNRDYSSGSNRALKEEIYIGIAYTSKDAKPTKTDWDSKDDTKNK